MNRKDYSGKDLYCKIFSYFPSISQKELANLIGVSEQLIAGWKKNKSRPSLDVLDKVAEIKGLSSDWWREKSVDIVNAAFDEGVEDVDHILSTVVARLEKENADLKDENAKLRSRIDALLEEKVELRERLASFIGKTSAG